MSRIRQSKAIKIPARMIIASSSDVDISSWQVPSVIHSTFWSESLVTPNHPLTLPSIAAVGKNSKRASDLRLFRKMSVVSGIIICHVLMKTTNWSKFTMFHRYLRPNARNRFKIKFPIEKVFNAVSSVSSRFWSLSISA